MNTALKRNIIWIENPQNCMSCAVDTLDLEDIAFTEMGLEISINDMSEEQFKQVVNFYFGV